MPPKPKTTKNASTKDTQKSLVVLLNRQDTFRHLKALCQNDDLFAISDYGEKWQDEDYERIVISNAKKLQGVSEGIHGAVIGTIRLLPSGSNTVVMFVFKDAFHHQQLSKSDRELFQKYIERAKTHFSELNILQEGTKKSFWQIVTCPQAQIVAAIIAFVGILVATINPPDIVSVLATQSAEAMTQSAKANPEAPTPLTANTTAVFPSPTQISTPIFTGTDTSTPDQISPINNTATSTAVVIDDCFSKTNWSPYEKDQSISSNNGCWDLSKWGFYAIDNGIQIIPNYPYSAGQFHGIYTPISNKVEIRFKVKVEKIGIDIEDRSANLGIGIINMEPLGPDSAKIIYYHFVPANSHDTISLKLGQGGNYETILPYTLNVSSEQSVALSINGHLMRMTVDGKTYEEIINIGFDKRAFWISYSAPQGTKMIAYIYDIEIK